ncbi:uncharacterized protein [Typha angustifolia]|uniref:uncharacterized protein n=1 Tax=Typha angustifolia TaxID=59011 RepID=UPI003C2C830A
MMSTSSSSSSSCASFSSFDDVTVKSTTGTIKFLCSYGGKILPRYPDGKLRYIGGDTRVLAVDRSVPFSELQAKLEELCGWESVSIRCQLPTEDLDALVSVISDEDLANLVEEYDLASRDRLLPLKIRSFLLPPPSSSSKAPKSFSPPSTPPISASAKGKSVFYHAHAARAPPPPSDLRCVHPFSAAVSRFSGQIENPGNVRYHHYHHHHHHHHQAYGNPSPPDLLVHHGNHWQ